MSRGRAALTAALLLSGGPAGAAHITDKLAVGLYAQRDGQGEAARVLISGTPVEVLERNARMCKVRLGSGESGWLECRYVTDEKPARAMLLEAQARLSQSRDEISRLKRDLKQETRRVQALEQELRSEREAGAERQAAGVVVAASSAPTPETAAHPDRRDWVLPALVGAAGGFGVGALALYLRCRRRYGGLRI